MTKPGGDEVGDLKSSAPSMRTRSLLNGISRYIHCCGLLSFWAWAAEVKPLPLNQEIDHTTLERSEISSASDRRNPQKPNGPRKAGCFSDPDVRAETMKLCRAEHWLCCEVSKSGSYKDV